MGSIRNRGTKARPSWSVRYKDATGRWREVTTHQPTRAAAAQYLADLEAREARVRKGLPVEEACLEGLRMTVGELADRWLVEYAPPRIKNLEEYRRQARSILRVRIRPTLGHLAAASLRPSDVERLRDRMSAEGYAPESIAHTLNTLSCMYRWARKAKILPVPSPVAEVERPSLSASLDPVGRDKYLTRDEAEALLLHLEEHGPPVLFALVVTALYTGARKGELAGARWSDLDLDAGVLHLARSYSLATKNGRARPVRVHPELARVLRAWRERCPVSAEGLMFPVGVRVPHMIDRKETLGLGDAIAAATRRRVPRAWHALRHTTATHLVSRGASLYAVGQLLGHRSYEITQRYAHAAPGFLAEEVARLDFTPRAPAGLADLAAARTDSFAGRGWGGDVGRPLGMKPHGADVTLEREKGFEPSTFSLGTPQRRAVACAQGDTPPTGGDDQGEGGANAQTRPATAAVGHPLGKVQGTGSE